MEKPTIRKELFRLHPDPMDEASRVRTLMCTRQDGVEDSLLSVERWSGTDRSSKSVEKT